uniref:ADAM metallopeptidase domain 15 n=1 Tax=Leptobrachium leishanense TaxID=445787 RepID=A0A8C5PYQ1_9ANUR
MNCSPPLSLVSSGFRPFCSPWSRPLRCTPFRHVHLLAPPLMNRQPRPLRPPVTPGLCVSVSPCRAPGEEERMEDKARGLLLLLCGLIAHGHPGDPGTSPEHTETPPAGARERETDMKLINPATSWDVYPDLRVRGRTLSLEEPAQSLPEQLNLSMEVDGRVIELELLQNRHLLPASHTLTYYLPDGTRVTEISPQLNNCFYHGKPSGRKGPWSSLCLCSGIRGTIILAPDTQYSIEPASGDPSNKHVLRLIHNDLPQNPSCGISGGRRDVHPPVRHRVKRDALRQVKYVELVIVADNSEYKLLFEDVKRVQMRMLEIANKLDAFFRALDVRVALVSVEVWNTGDQITVSTDPAQMLTNFLSWREKSLSPAIRHDNAQLLTGITFKDSSVGMATMNSLCTDKSGGVNMDHSVSVLGVASTLAHNLGHNLGLVHDTTARKCGEPEKSKQWIMEPSFGFMPGLEFSQCSVRDFLSSLRNGRFMCLYNVPSPGSLYGGARCGNTMVEEGEQCDCGLTQDCADPCCNASTCQFTEGAECASDGSCCAQCKNGESCEGGQAYCFDGECRTIQSQCQNLWGPGSSPAPDSCFSALNIRGDQYGNCGQRENSTYLPCADRDAMCGKIQCLSGSDQTPLGSNPQTIAVSVTVNGTEQSCRGAYFQQEDIMDAELVLTGTVCGTGKVCIKQRCQDVSALQVQSCKNKCSNHGVCDNNNTCHCDPGWAMPDCGAWALKQAGGSLTTTLCLVFLLFLPLLALFGFCLIKRDCLKKRLGMFGSGSKCQYRVTQSNSQPRPQRPPPPTRTQSTELQPMNYSQDSDRPDPPSKPLPPDPVHKRCQYPDQPHRPTKPLQPDTVRGHCQAPDQNRPPPPTRPLPADPLLRQAQTPMRRKPPIPKKPQSLNPLLTAPVYPDPVTALPSRPAPLPPYSGSTPQV